MLNIMQAAAKKGREAWANERMNIGVINFTFKLQVLFKSCQKCNLIIKQKNKETEKRRNRNVKNVRNVQHKTYNVIGW